MDLKTFKILQSLVGKTIKDIECQEPRDPQRDNAEYFLILDDRTRVSLGDIPQVRVRRVDSLPRQKISPTN